MFTDSDTLIPKNYDRHFCMVVLNNDHTQTLSLETDEINMDNDFLYGWFDVKDSATEKTLGNLIVKTAKNAKFIRGIEIVVETLTINRKIFVSNEQIIQYSYKKHISFIDPDKDCYRITIYI